MFYEPVNRSEFRINYISDMAVIQPASAGAPQKAVLFAPPFVALQGQWSFQLQDVGRHQRLKAKQIAE